MIADIGSVLAGRATNPVPEAYLWVGLYKQDSTPVGERRVALTDSLPAGEWQQLLAKLYADSAGYVEVALRDESPQAAYFDDLLVRVIKANGIQEHHYDPWGLSLVGIGTRPLDRLERRQFNGKPHIEDFGLHWNFHDARTLDVQIPRWHQVDPLADVEGQESLSSYHFSYNNPVRYSDPDGRCPTWPTMLAGAIIGGVISGAVAAYEGKDFADVATAAAGGAVAGAIAGSGVGLIAELGLGTGGAIAVNGAAGFVAGAAQELTTEGIAVGTGRREDISSARIAQNAMIGSVSNVAGGLISELVIAPVAAAVSKKVAANIVASTTGRTAQAQIRRSVAVQNPALRNNNKALNKAVGAVLRTRKREASSAGLAAGRLTTALAEKSMQAGSENASNQVNDRLNENYGR